MDWASPQNSSRAMKMKSKERRLVELKAHTFDLYRVANRHQAAVESVMRQAKDAEGKVEALEAEIAREASEKAIPAPRPRRRATRKKDA